MDLNMQQRIVQQQKLILTNEMQQSLKILQMPIFELQQDIYRELEENPLLELDTIEVENVEYEKENYKELNDIDYREVLNHNQNDNDYNSNFSSDEANVIDPLNFIIEKKTLKDYLLDQLLELDENKIVIEICEYIIENIDERGYLNCSINEIANELQVSTKDVGLALKIVQEFQPLGVGARNLKECLQIQLKMKNIEDENIYKIVEEYLELIGDNKIKEISKKLNLDMKKIQEYCDIIRSLEPKPSRGFYTGNLENYVIPEAYIRKIGNKIYIVMNENILPRLIINKAYKDIIKDKGDNKAVEFVKNKLNSAVFLVKGIEQRNKTIYRVLEKIAEIQEEYFNLGEHYLKPMTIGDVADELSLNKSTISRAIKDKYISTPFNTLLIKDLFTTGIESNLNNEDLSTKFIKNEIKKLIDAENKSKPLSDQDICKLLADNKIDIARRTVAKYREELQILSSSKRKRI